jgi:KDO2-lipid IV(A) lauroyltransferase
MMDVMIQRGRSRFADTQIPRDNVRMLLKRLRQNDIVLYMPDQTYLGNQSALLPFFGETAVTNIATSKLASISGAIVLPMLFSRRADDKGYVVKIGAPLDNFPSDDPAADTLRLVEILEAHIRRVPEQYLWLYKKFKARPAPYPDLYRN